MFREVVGGLIARYCCSPAAGLCRHAPPRRQAFAPSPVPFPVLHVDTGTTSPRSSPTATAVDRLGGDSSSRVGLDRRWPIAGTARRHVTRCGDRAAPRDHHWEQVRCRIRRRRRDEEKARGRRNASSACATSSASGTPVGSALSCGTSTAAATDQASMSGVPAIELDRSSTWATCNAKASNPRALLQPRARRVLA